MPKFIPQEGLQEALVRTTVDVAFAGAGASTGKTFAIILAVAPYLHIPQFRALFFRRTLGEVGAVGGMVDEIKRVYDFKRITESKIPEMEFESGAKIMLSHLANEDPEYLRERLRGYQADYIFLDEGTSYEFSTFNYLLSRNRGSSGIGGKFRMAYNPKRSHWTRRFVDWYIGEDGYPIQERIGVVRYFFIKNEKDVTQVEWGDTKQEVYLKCKSRIDQMMQKSKGEAKYEDFIKSFVFYTGDIYANKEFLKNNKTYISSLASLGDTVAKQLLLNNHNVDEDDYTSLQVTEQDINNMFENDPQNDGEYSITADIALGGKDNFVLLAWKGRHCINIHVMEKCTAQQALMAIRQFQIMYNVADSRVVFDGVSIGEFIGGAYGMITGAVSFKPQAPPKGLGKHNYQNLKTQCADKLCTFVKHGNITIAKDVANFMYKNQHMKVPKTVRDVIFDEFRVVRFDEIKGTGKRKLINKETQKELLSGRSPDMIDNLIYQCYLHLDHTDEEMFEMDKMMMLGNNTDNLNELFNYMDEGDF